MLLPEHNPNSDPGSRVVTTAKPGTLSLPGGKPRRTCWQRFPGKVQPHVASDRIVPFGPAVEACFSFFYGLQHVSDHVVREYKSIPVSLCRVLHCSSPLVCRTLRMAPYNMATNCPNPLCSERGGIRNIYVVGLNLVTACLYTAVLQQYQSRIVAQMAKCQSQGTDNVS